MAAGPLQGFPQISAPLVYPGSLIPTQPWYRFFIELWLRTGGGTNIIPIPAQIDILENEIATLRTDVQAQIQAAIADVMAWLAPPQPPLALPYIVSPFVPGLLAADQLIALHRFVDNTTVSPDFSGSQFGATVAATADTVITIDRAPAATPNTFATIGTITVGAGTVIGSFATVSHLAYQFAIGDVLRAMGPHVPDVTLANIYFAIAGTR